MPLADDLRRLKDRALAELAAAHDYYAETARAWYIVRRLVRKGRSISMRNPVTGSAASGAELAARGQSYVVKQLAETTFQQFVALFETHFFGLLRLWLRAYPASLGQKTITFDDVLRAADKDALADPSRGARHAMRSSVSPR